MAIVQEYIWFVLAGAALVAFLFGILVRGVMTSAKARRATVERDVALTELDQVRGELDSLYAAQRKQREASAETSSVGPDELRERDERLSKVSQELETAKAELESLRESRQDQAPAPEPATGETDEDLKARNAFLEERVGELEAKVHTLGNAPQAPTEKGVPDDSSKADWQIGFLKSRVEALEEKLLEKEGQAAIPQQPQADPAADEELARLRWRNRYLEGRLAYFEEAPAARDADVSETETPAQTASDEPASPEIVPETATPDSLEPADEPNPVAEVPEDGDGDHPSERMLRALDASEQTGEGEPDPAEDDGTSSPDTPDTVVEGQPPAALDKPDGEADDLTLITGIGPRIQSILNDLGIWHFSQIADWSAGNEVWIDDQLNFAGRVGREGWVYQARELVRANANPA